MSRLLLIANPAASGFTGALHRQVRGALSKDHDLIAVWPNSADEARTMAAEAAATGVDIVAAMGGDGVAHHVANGLAGSQTALGIIPVGTTNVLARILGIPTKAARAATLLAGSPTAVPIPLAAITAETTSGTVRTHGLFAVGVGVDADLVEEAEKRPHGKVRFGGLHYARTAAGLMRRSFRGRPANLRVETADRHADAVGAMVQVHWPYTYFGPRPLRFTPEPIPDLSVLVLHHLGFRNGFSLFGRALANRPLDGADGAEIWTGVDKLVVEADPPALLQADGEILGSIRAVEVSQAADRLLVVRPQ